MSTFASIARVHESSGGSVGRSTLCNRAGCKEFALGSKAFDSSCVGGINRGLR